MDACNLTLGFDFYQVRERIDYGVKEGFQALSGIALGIVNPVSGKPFQGREGLGNPIHPGLEGRVQVKGKQGSQNGLCGLPFSGFQPPDHFIELFLGYAVPYKTAARKDPVS